MKLFKTFLAVIPLALTALVHCSSTSSGTSASGGSDGGNVEDGGATQGVPSQHRATAAACAVPRAPSVTHDGGFNPNNPFATCHADAECTQGKNGRCGAVYNSAACACDYDDCASDADCPNGGTCVCRTESSAALKNRCAPKGDCATDADCGTGGYCSPSLLLGDTCNPTNTAFYCHTAQDECANDSDCTGGHCIYQPTDKSWTCKPYPGCDGGPAPTCQ